MGDRDQINTEDQDNSQLREGFLPDLCSTAAVLSLVLVGELLSLALALAADGLRGFSWAKFGLVSLLVQWVVLASAASLCTLRRHLNRLKPAQAVSICYVMVLAYTFVFSILSSWFNAHVEGFVWSSVFTNVCISAIFSGVLFRYLYLQQLLKLQQQSELSARLQALQSRIRPHFLFNSLNSIASLIAIKPELAEKLVVDLAQLFRASLQLPQLIPVEQELALCYCFCDIEKVRLGKRLEVEWQVDELSKDTKILNLLIQPLIENAIYHGVQPLPKGGKVNVEVKHVKGDVVVRVTNPRLPGSELQTNHNPEPSSGNGIALSNIRGRLDAHYGKKAYLRVVKGEADFSVVVRYPTTRPFS